MKPVRRTDREICKNEARELLDRGEYGVLSTVGSDGQPYGVPISYVRKGDAIYFHCALTGHKLDNIAADPRVSFAVVGTTKVLPDKFATEYESAVVFGTASEVTGTERTDALIWLVEKYSPEHIEAGKRYLEQHDRATRVFRIDIRHLSGKARR